MAGPSAGRADATLTVSDFSKPFRPVRTVKVLMLGWGGLLVPTLVPVVGQSVDGALLERTAICLNSFCLRNVSCREQNDWTENAEKSKNERITVAFNTASKLMVYHVSFATRSSWRTPPTFYFLLLKQQNRDENFLLNLTHGWHVRSKQNEIKVLQN